MISFLFMMHFWTDATSTSDQLIAQKIQYFCHPSSSTDLATFIICFYNKQVACSHRQKHLIEKTPEGILKARLKSCARRCDGHAAVLKMFLLSFLFSFCSDSKSTFPVAQKYKLLFLGL